MAKAKVSTKNPPFAVPSWPALEVTSWKLGAIKPYERNARTHPESQVEILAGLMKRWGVDQPIVVDENGVILKGHGRLLAAYKAGFEEFPVARHLGLSEHDKNAIRLADNQTSLLSEWDQEKLQLHLEELALAGFDTALLGFSASALDGMGVETVSLSERFGVVPFSIFNAREGVWQDRKRAWLALGIQSEVGRGENLLKYSDSVALDGKAYNERFKGKKRSKARNGKGS